MQNFRNNVSFYNRENNCGCERRMADRMPERASDRMPVRMPEMMCDPVGNMPLAMAYVPWQTWQNIFEADKSFHLGTIFQDLCKPFEHAGGGCR